MNVGKRVVGQGLGHAPLDQIGRRVHLGGAQVVDDRSRLPIGRVPALLGMNSLEHMAHLADLGRRYVAEDIPVEMHHAALPSRLWQVLSRALHQAAAGIRNDQLHAREAAIDQVSQKRRPTGFVLLGALADAENIGSSFLILEEAVNPESAKDSVRYHPDTPSGVGKYFLASFEAAAGSLGIEPVAMPVRSDAEIETAIAALGAEQAGLVEFGTFLAGHAGTIISSTARHNVPAIFQGTLICQERRPNLIWGEPHGHVPPRGRAAIPHVGNTPIAVYRHRAIWALEDTGPGTVPL